MMLPRLCLLAAAATAFRAPALGGAGAAPLRAGGGGFGAPAPRPPPPAKVKKYSKAALEFAYEQFEALTAAKGTFVVDLYCGAPGGSKLFFVGKVAHDLKTPPECALAALAHLLGPHARFLQPLLNAHPDLEWFVAPGNSEVQVAKGEAAVAAIAFGTTKASHHPGFAPEWYEDGEDGFYVRREDGDD